MRPLVQLLKPDAKMCPYSREEKGDTRLSDRAQYHVMETSLWRGRHSVSPPRIDISAIVTFRHHQAKETPLDLLSLGPVTAPSYLPLPVHPATCIQSLLGEIQMVSWLLLQKKNKYHKANVISKGSLLQASNQQYSFQ